MHLSQGLQEERLQQGKRRAPSVAVSLQGASSALCNIQDSRWSGGHGVSGALMGPIEGLASGEHLFTLQSA